MFGFLKNILRRPPATAEDSLSESGPETVATSERPAYSNTFFPPSPAPARKNLPSQHGKGIEISLQRILNTLPLELQPRVTQTDVGDLTISVPLEKILSQLSRGVVKISFGELRQALPDLFTLENDRDRVLVPLPLEDILAHLNPVLITRRRVQRQVEVPSEIRSPFDVESQRLVFEESPEPAEIELSAPRHTSRAAAAPVTPARPAASLPAAPSAPAAAPTPAAPVTISQRFNFKPASPAQAAPPTALPPLTIQAASPAQTVYPPVPAPAPPPPADPVLRAATRALEKFNQHPAPAAPAPVPQSTKPEIREEPVIVGLTSLAESWPEAVRKEIVDLNLVDAKLALPANAVEQALKQGRIAFSWKTLRSWIKPAVLPAVSAHDGAVLELPLKIVAPLFLARQQEAAKNKQKVAVDEDIPNLFFGFPQPEPANGVPVSAATARAGDTNYYVWNDSSDVANVDESDTKRGPSPGTKFVAKYATPNEVVSRATGLDGVAGALIALPDGLMVASRLSSDLNADTLAAFLPQIFGKVSQCTKELRMGDLNNLNFTVGNVPWKIFRVNAIFFAAFGRAGEPLPTAQLAALAAELDHKPK